MNLPLAENITLTEHWCCNSCRHFNEVFFRLNAIPILVQGFVRIRLMHGCMWRNVRATGEGWYNGCIVELVSREGGGNTSQDWDSIKTSLLRVNVAVKKHNSCPWS